MSEAEKLAPGSFLWIEGSDREYILGEVTSRDGVYLTVKSKEGKVSLNVDRDEIYRMNPRLVDDMTALQFFHVPGILHNIRERAVGDEPFTFLGGSVLVAVNPLKPLPDPQGALGTSKATSVAHPFAIAETAYQQLIFAAGRKDNDEATNQSIVIGGESGAGKTESSKMLVRHLVQRSVNNGAKDEGLDEKLLQSNPILEAFGNAATVRNSNSSRFGKFMKLHFKSAPGGKGRDMVICGGSVETYLLERSRVTQHSLGERNFHVFYQLVTGASKSMRNSFELDKSFEYMKAQATELAGGRRARPKSMAKLEELGKFDKKNFKELCAALESIGIGQAGDDAKQDDLFALVAAVLHMGNLKFEEKEGATTDEAIITSEAALGKAASLLGVDAKSLEKLFIERPVKTAGETIISKRDAESAKFAVDAVSKALYVSTFDWLVDRITASLSGNTDFDEHPFIGVLDIFGFESFRRNDFEQLLINFTNEALQNTFNMQIFEAEADLYRKEGLVVDSKDRIMPEGNEETMMLLAGVKGDRSKPGILGLIDAETKNPQASDAKLNSAIHRTYENGSSSFGRIHPKDKKHCFSVIHYAGEIKYTTGHFIERNVDKIPEEVQMVFEVSSSPLVNDMFTRHTKAGTNAKAVGRAMTKATSTIAGRFQRSIEELVSTLDSTKASFIRCIKPNSRMERKSGKGWFNSDYVMKQLHNLSIPATAQVLKGGLPTRISFQQIVQSYASLMPEDAIKLWKVLGGGEDRLFVTALFHAFQIPPIMFKVGLTRVFFKSGMLDELNHVLNLATAGKLDDEIVEGFRFAFLRTRWRRVFAAVVAFKAFKDILEDGRARNSAATILQRVAKRRAREARRRAEEARRLEEQRKREEEEARRRAEEQRIVEEQRKKEREAAEKAKRIVDAERIRQQELRARALRLREEENAVEQERMATIFAEQLRSADEDRMAAEEIERAETEKVVTRLGGEAQFEKQKKKEKKKKVRFVLPENDDGDDGPGSSEAVQRIRRKAEKKVGRKSMAPALSDMPPDELDLPDFFEDVKFQEIELKKQRPMSLTLNSKGANAKKKEKKVLRQGDKWKTCQIIVSGIKLQYFSEITMDGIVPRGIGKLGDVELNPATTEMEIVESSPGEQIIRFTVRRPDGTGKRILFMMVDPDANDNLLTAYKQAIEQYRQDQELSQLFERGELDKYAKDEMKEAQEWLRQKIITREEFDELIMQQITTAADVLQAQVARYGELGVRDYRVECGNCGSAFFILPGADDNPLECDFCSNPLPELNPEEEEADALAYRELVDERIAQELGVVKDSGFPTTIVIPTGNLLVEACQIESFFDTDALEKVFRFSFEARLYNTSRDAMSVMESFSFGMTWLGWKYFRRDLAEPLDQRPEKLKDKDCKKIPAFPDDVSNAKTRLQRAQKRKPRVEEFVLNLLIASQEISNFWELDFVRKAFGLPLDLKRLAKEVKGGVLTPEQLQAIATFADELMAQKQAIEINNGGGQISGVLVRSLADVQESVQTTAARDIVMSASKLDHLSTEEKEALSLKAQELQNQLHEVLSGLVM